MKNYAVISILTICLYFSGCSKTGTGPENKIDPVGYQKEIDWPSLADSPWPMFQHNPQGTGRSRFQGPQKGINTKIINLDSGSELSFVVIDENKKFYIAIGNYWTDSAGVTDAYLFSYNFQGVPNCYVNINGRELLSSPLIDQNGVIYIGSTVGIFYAIKPDGSFTVWEAQVLI